MPGELMMRCGVFRTVIDAGSFCFVVAGASEWASNGQPRRVQPLMLKSHWRQDRMSVLE